MIKKFQKACEDISGKPFHKSILSQALALPLIFILGMFGFYLFKIILFIMLGNWAEVPWITLIIFPLYIGLYYFMIVLWGWVYRKTNTH
jgi:hypothetical protein